MGLKTGRELILRRGSSETYRPLALRPCPTRRLPHCAGSQNFSSERLTWRNSELRASRCREGQSEIPDGKWRDPKVVSVSATRIPTVRCVLPAGDGRVLFWKVQRRELIFSCPPV